MRGKWEAWVLALCLGACRPATRSADQRCLFSDDCQPGLLCAGGYCRVVCRTDLDCANGFRCATSPSPDKRVCLPPGEPPFCVYHSDCLPPGCDGDGGCAGSQLCAADNRCHTQCLAERDCTSYHPDLHCVADAGVCLWSYELEAGRAP